MVISARVIRISNSKVYLLARPFLVMIGTATPAPTPIPTPTPTTPPPAPAPAPTPTPTHPAPEPAPGGGGGYDHMESPGVALDPNAPVNELPDLS